MGISFQRPTPNKTTGLGRRSDLDTALPPGSFIKTALRDDFISPAAAELGYDVGHQIVRLTCRPLGLGPDVAGSFRIKDQRLAPKNPPRSPLGKGGRTA